MYDENSEENVLCRYIGKEKIVTVPEGVTTIRKFAFASDFEPNNTIEKIILSSTVLKVEKEAFAYCKSLKTIIFNEEVEDIIFSCFRGCDLIEEIIIPPRIESIIAFERPANLKKIYVNDNIKQINEGAFDIYLEDIDDFERHTSEILLENPVYKIIDGFMVNTKFMTTLYRIDKTKKTVYVPDGIITIGTDTFSEITFGIYDDEIESAQRVETVILPESVRHIEYNAFNYCENLRCIKYEGKHVNLDIDEYAFDNCENYTNNAVLIECADLKTNGNQKSKRITHFMLERFKIIHKAIQSGCYPNTKDLQSLCSEELGDSFGIATISRDLEYLRNSMDAPIEFDRFQNGYFYSTDFELKL